MSAERNWAAPGACPGSVRAANPIIPRRGCQTRPVRVGPGLSPARKAQEDQARIERATCSGPSRLLPGCPAGSSRRARARSGSGARAAPCRRRTADRGGHSSCCGRRPSRGGDAVLAPGPERIARGGLELDDLGPEIGELQRQHVARDEAGRVQHAHPVERAGLLRTERLGRRFFISALLLPGEDAPRLFIHRVVDHRAAHGNCRRAPASAAPLKAATIPRACDGSASLGVNTAFTTSICAGWMQHLPLKPMARARGRVQQPVGVANVHGKCIGPCLARRQGEQETGLRHRAGLVGDVDIHVRARDQGARRPEAGGAVRHRRPRRRRAAARGLDDRHDLDATGRPAGLGLQLGEQPVHHRPGLRTELRALDSSSRECLAGWLVLKMVEAKGRRGRVDAKKN